MISRRCLFDDEQILREHNTAHVTPPPLAYTPTPPVLATMEPLDTFLMGDEVINTILKKENDEFIKSSVDDLVPILRESKYRLTFRRSFRHPLNGDRKVDFNPSRDIEELEHLLADDPVPVPRVFDAPLGNSDSISRSYDMTFSNHLFDFNDDYTICYDYPLFDEEFGDIISLDLLESTTVIDESSLLVTPLPDPKQICLREVERFDPFFSLTQSGGMARFPSGESKVHIEVLSVLWGNRLPIPDGSLPLSRLLDHGRLAYRCGSFQKKAHSKNNKSETDKSLLDHGRLAYRCGSFQKGRGSPGRNKTPGPWSARIPMWQLFKGPRD
ncbi:hypothetical protein Tco_1161066 [Tanacetum coccineum]